MNVASRCSCSYLLCRSIQGEVDLTDIITPSTPDACEPGDDPGDTYARLEGLISATPPAARFWRRGDPMPPPDPVSLPLPIRNGRTFQAAAGSEAVSFDVHGFALLRHATAFRHWRADPRSFGAVYHAEIDALLRDRLFPGRRVEIDHFLTPVFRGGPDDPIYAHEVHQDYGLGADAFAANLKAVDPAEALRWQTRYAQDDVTGCIVISCWRTIGMQGPLRYKPLALCDPLTVRMDDVFADTATPGSHGSYCIQLRRNDAQRWYSYPNMRADEMIAFKLFDCRKDDPGSSRLRSVFHAAFDDPAMPADAERRTSCEDRLVVMLLRD